MQVLDIVISQPASRLEGLLKLSVGMVLSARGWPPHLQLRDWESLVLLSFTLPPPDQRLSVCMCLWSPALPVLTSLIWTIPANIRLSDTLDSHTYPVTTNTQLLNLNTFQPALQISSRQDAWSTGQRVQLSLAGLGSFSFAAGEKGNLGLLFRFWKQARVEKERVNTRLRKAF